MKNNDTPAWARASTGTVIKINRWGETEVWSSGGGGFVDPLFGGRVSAAQVHSSVSQRCEAFYKDDSGKEGAVELGFTGLKLREGSRLFRLWGSETGADEGSYAYIENLDTGEAWTQRRPQIDGGGFFSWIFRSILLLLFIWPIIYFSIYLMEKPDPSIINAKVQEIVSNCPPGTSVAPQKASPNARPFCKYGDWESRNNVIIKCNCPDEAKVRTSVELAEEKITNRNSSFRTSGAKLMALLLGPAISFPLGLIWLISSNSNSRRATLAQRKAFVEMMIDSAKEKGIALMSPDIESMSLRRVKA